MGVGREWKTDKWRGSRWGGGEEGRKSQFLQREWGQIEDEEPECVCACVFSVWDEGREIN